MGCLERSGLSGCEQTMAIAESASEPTSSASWSTAAATPTRSGIPSTAGSGIALEELSVIISSRLDVAQQYPPFSRTVHRFDQPCLIPSGSAATHNKPILGPASRDRAYLTRASKTRSPSSAGGQSHTRPQRQQGSAGASRKHCRLATSATVRLCAMPTHPACAAGPGSLARAAEGSSPARARPGARRTQLMEPISTASLRAPLAMSMGRWVPRVQSRMRPRAASCGVLLREPSRRRRLSQQIPISGPFVASLRDATLTFLLMLRRRGARQARRPRAERAAGYATCVRWMSPRRRGRFGGGRGTGWVAPCYANEQIDRLVGPSARRSISLRCACLCGEREFSLPQGS